MSNNSNIEDIENNNSDCVCLNVKEDNINENQKNISQNANNKYFTKKENGIKKYEDFEEEKNKFNNNLVYNGENDMNKISEKKNIIKNEILELEKRKSELEKTISELKKSITLLKNKLK